jgi:hypothetical protein
MSGALKLEYLNSGWTARATSDQALVAHSFNPVANSRSPILRETARADMSAAEKQRTNDL